MSKKKIFKSSVYYPYIGHKNFENKELIDLNYDNLNTCVEVFCGMFGFSHYMYKNNIKKFDKYIFNDINSKLINFLKDIQNGELKNYVEYYNNNYKKLYDDINIFRELKRNKNKDKYNEFLYNYSVGGYGGHLLRHYNCKNAQHLIKDIDIRIFDILNEIINKSELYNEDFNKILNKYKDDKDALIYLDPPYLDSYNIDYVKNYENENENKDKKIILDNTQIYIDILNFINSCKCKFILIINDNAITRFLYKDYILSSYGHTYQGTKRKNTHLIISNLKYKK
jgi:site-specific DNA-adenine methylase